ncbi:MAG: AI-2E family transporter [Halofilum sp. (in: g-proteobacteria)]
MLEVIRTWYRRNFTDPEAVILAIFLIVGFSVIIFAGELLAPVLMALVLAYLLEGVVARLEYWRVPRLAAVSLVLLGFLVTAVVVLIGLIPLLSRQVVSLVREVPSMVAQGQQALLRLPELYPALFTEEQIRNLIASLHSEVGELGRAVVSVSLAQAVSLFTFAIYMILVPLLVFFTLKDKDRMMAWARRFLPHRRQLASRVWHEVNAKIGNYIRGKIIEIAIVWAISYATFSLMGLNYSLLLSFSVGLSVIIPYIGAIVVTIPIAIIAYFQWGLVADFWWLLLAYQIIQLIDGNVLVPVLFSEVVDLHPVAIMVSLVFFGGIWGFWGVFFAIPLATLVHAVLNSWPRVRPPLDDGRGEASELAETDESAEALSGDGNAVMAPGRYSSSPK